ncbi:hypothetical protein GQA70_08760 [Ponticoccus alexandrii]|uniref:Uncharacterized protein n=2 Tax=Ponticoccus alexandrii TaxID=1943633 RepID=A0ABX7F7Z9_9RHOB|nr:hypothetical protein GQA70_08760 [Ponticoccus alexandrii]
MTGLRMAMLGAALALVIGGAVMLGLVGHGRKIEGTARDARAGQDYREGRQDVDAATGNLPDDDAGVVEWLRELADGASD